MIVIELFPVTDKLFHMLGYLQTLADGKKQEKIVKLMFWVCDKYFKSLYISSHLKL